MRKEIDALLKAGCIRPSKSPYASPVIIVKKPDGSVWVCVGLPVAKSNNHPGDVSIAAHMGSCEFVGR